MSKQILPPLVHKAVNDQIEPVEETPETRIPTIDEARDIARYLYLQEVVMLENKQFPKPTDKQEILQTIKENYETSLELLDKNEKSDAEEINNDPEHKTVANWIWQFVRSSLRYSVESIKNYGLRKEYISLIKIKSQEMSGLFEDLKAGNVPKNNPEVTLADLAAEAVRYRNATLDTIRLQQSATSVSFAKMLKETGLTMDELLKLYANRIFGKAYTELEEAAQIEVLAAVIIASGRSNSTVTGIVQFMGRIAPVFIAFILTVMLVDIITSETPILTAIKDVLEVGLGAVFGQMASQLAFDMLLETSVGPVGLFAAAVTAGLIVGVGIALLIEWFVSLFKSPEFKSWPEITVSLLTPPDGAKIVRQVMQ